MNTSSGYNMEGIYDPNDSFDFSKLVLSKPTAIPGGNYFIRISYLENPLYIQPPKCTTKQGILKAGKRQYSDLMFSNEHDSFTRWMENLEAQFQKTIYENRAQWFEGDMELHDIENYFTPPLKSYKSGKFYLVRVNITPVLGKTALKIYDENEKDISLESIDDETRVLTILEIQGIKCSAKSFQIEIELKQMMVLKSINLFEKCLLTGSKGYVDPKEEKQDRAIDGYQKVESIDLVKDLEELETPLFKEKREEKEEGGKEEKEEREEEEEEPLELSESITYSLDEVDTHAKSEDSMEEIDFDVDELPKEDTFQLKQRKEVYYEIYKQAVKKAKLAREMAISAYLEAKQIKNTYMIQDLDDSDLEEDDFEFQSLS